MIASRLCFRVAPRARCRCNHSPTNYVPPITSGHCHLACRVGPLPHPAIQALQPSRIGRIEGAVCACHFSVGGAFVLCAPLSQLPESRRSDRRILGQIPAAHRSSFPRPFPGGTPAVRHLPVGPRRRFAAAVIARAARRMPCTDSLTSRGKAAVRSSCAPSNARAYAAAAPGGSFGRKGVRAHSRLCLCVFGERAFRWGVLSDCCTSMRARRCWRQVHRRRLEARY